jgi:hypothetical protein
MAAVQHSFSYKDFPLAYDRSSNYEDGVIKSLILWQDDMQPPSSIVTAPRRRGRGQQQGAAGAAARVGWGVVTVWAEPGHHHRTARL